MAKIDVDLYITIQELGDIFKNVDPLKSMGDMLRSDPMSYCDMYLQPETAFEILSRLGEMGRVQFTDMNPDLTAFQKRYIPEVCRCAEMERKLRFIESEMVKDQIPMPYPTTDPNTMDQHQMAQFETTLEKWEEDIGEMADNQADLLKSHTELKEMYYVLKQIGPLLGDAELLEDFNSNRTGRGDIGPGGRLFVKTGVVKRAKCFHFETMLFRISRGNIYYRQANVDKIFVHPYTGQEVRKVAFLAICQGEQLSIRMDKVFSGFRVENYPCPQTAEERNKKIRNIHASIVDLEKVLNTTTYHRCRALRTVGHEWAAWMIRVRKSKAVYHTMNLFTLDITKNCLIGQCWVPDKDLNNIQQTLKTCSNEIGTNVQSFMSKTGTKNMVPPTFHRTNKFTHGFQALINAYGDSKYGELNPGLYTIITFPFLFALMFGDIGHATILILFGAWMLKNEKKFMSEKSDNEIWTIFFGGRYIILMLGLFSFFTGFVYNDIFSCHLSFRPSYFMNVEMSKQIIMNSDYSSLDPADESNPPYLFGMDPIWGLSSNKIMIENMVKMKMSIIIGIIHMIFGIGLSLINHIHSKQYYLIFLQFIPEMVFLCSLFLWLVVMIYYKWFMFGGHGPDLQSQPGCAPQILILFIDMVLFKETKAEEEACNAYLFNGQRALQMYLVGCGLVCVPVLLLGTPLYVNRLNNQKREAENKLQCLCNIFVLSGIGLISSVVGLIANIQTFAFTLYVSLMCINVFLNEKGKGLGSTRRYRYSMEGREKSQLEVQEEEEIASEATFSDLMIHQAVHTIEFVLSTISHTASYLRLWALSLAHAQLSEMLWIMILSKLALQDRTAAGIPKLFFVFAIWAMFTLSILVLMEGLSAFLHTLRLHWVEFMSKFYHGGGYPFRPFCFKELLALEADRAEPACKIQDRKSKHQFDLIQTEV